MFDMAGHGTRLRTECTAGVTTFLAMAYILVVNPRILGSAGMDPGAVFVATALAAALGSAIMGLLANYPIALAPGMGLNAFFAYTLVLGQGYSWQQALGAVFLAGLAFVLLSVCRVREAIVNGLPHSLKVATSAGIGLFLGALALQSAGLVVDHPATLTGLGDVLSLPALLTLLGFVLIVVLNRRGLPGGTLLGMAGVALLGLPLGLSEYSGVLAAPPDIAPIALALDLSRALEPAFLLLTLSLLYVEVFDTAGTLVGVSHRAGLLDARGRLPRMRRALLADSTASVAGALLGTSSTTCYIESAAGTAVGGRTGLTALVTAACFVLALFFAPLLSMVPAAATSAALLYVACVMSRGLAELDWGDPAEYVPGVLTALVMPLSFSIAAGIGLGVLSHVLIKLASGRGRELSATLWLLAVAFCGFFYLDGTA